MISSFFLKNRFEIGLFLFYLLVIVSALFFHEPWRDEMQCWVIAKESNSFYDLLHKSRYEGHPSGWYVILYLLTRFSGDFIVVRICHLMISAGVVYLILFKSPFSKLQKCLAVSGYFFIYEYAVLSRNYVIGILLLLAVCYLLKNQKKYWLVICALLFSAMQTNVFAAIISCAIFTPLFIRTSFLLINKKIVKTPLNIGVFVAGTLLFIAGFLLCFFDILPPGDSTFMPDWKWANPEWQQALSAFSHAMAPVPKMELNFWNSHILQHILNGQKLLVIENVLACTIFLICIFSLRKNRLSLSFFLLAWLAISVFISVKYVGFMRHHGHYFIAYMMALWIKDEAENKKQSSLFFTILLSLHFMAAAIAITIDIKYPFTQSKSVATFIEKNYPSQQQPLVGHFDYATSPVAFHLERPIFYPNQNKEGTFIYWDHKRFEKEISDITTAIGAICQKNGPFLLLTCYPLTQEQSATGSIELIQIFAPSIVKEESYWLYEVHCL